MRVAAIEPIQVLCRLVESGEERVAARALGGPESLALSALTKGGLLVPDGVISSIVCDACDRLHESLVEYFPGRKCYGWYCPKAGQIDTPNETVLALRLDLHQLVHRLSTAFCESFGSKRGRVAPLAETSSWTLAAYQIARLETTVLLAARVDNARAANTLNEQLAKLIPMDTGLVLLTADREVPLHLPGRFRTLPLSEAVLVQADGTFSVCEQVIASTIETAGRDRYGRAGRPSLEQSIWQVLDDERAN
jgi:hypothetical protein